MFSSRPSTSSTDVAPSSLMRSKIWFTNSSGAEAPAVTPINCASTNHSGSISCGQSIK
ncbi:Uncharacterised protein [Vibrio cholerae]|nr:Uncharacterised protein [Vibrio cholerae]CSC82435.1 Uncharacterised protein [Vibrio cholerae]